MVKNMLVSVYNIFIFAFIILTFYGIRKKILKRINIKTLSFLEDYLISSALGICLVVLILYILGLFSLLYSFIIVPLFVLLFIYSAKDIKNFLFVFRQKTIYLIKESHNFDIFIKIIAVLFLFVLAVNLINDLALPMEGDALHSYLEIPKLWVEAHQYYQPTHKILSSLPANMMFINAIGLLFSNGSLSLLLNGFYFSVLATLLIYVIASKFVKKEYALLSAFTFYFIPEVWYHIHTVKVDLGWAFFDVLAVYLCFKFLFFNESERNIKYLMLSGIFIGFSIGAKFSGLFSLFLISFFLLCTLLARKTDKKEIIKYIAVFIIFSFILGSHTYIYNFVQYNNPVFPAYSRFFHELIGGKEIGIEMTSNNPNSGILGYITIYWDMSLKKDFAFGMGMWAGPMFLIFIPLLFFVNKKIPKEMKLILLFVFLYSILWYLTKQRTRHFLPGLMLLSTLIGYIVYHITLDKKYLKYITFFVIFFIFLYSAIFPIGYLKGTGSYKYVFGLENRDNFLERNLDRSKWYPSFKVTNYINNNLKKDDGIVSVGLGWNSYYLDRGVHISWWYYNGVDLTKIQKEDELLKYIKEYNIKYIWINWYGVEQYSKGHGRAGKGEDYVPSLFEKENFRNKYFKLVLKDGKQEIYQIKPNLVFNTNSIQK